MCQCKGAAAQACYIKSERGCPAPTPRVSFIVMRGVKEVPFKSANTVRSAELSFEALAVAPFTIMEGLIMGKIELPIRHWHTMCGSTFWCSERWEL